MDVSPYGSLKNEGDHYVGFGLSTRIGPVDAQIDGADFPVLEMQGKIRAVLGKMDEVDRQARAYLQATASHQDVQASGGLIEPSLLLGTDDAPGDFTLFYSGSREDDETCYGVVFRDFTPFDLAIGD